MSNKPKTKITSIRFSEEDHDKLKKVAGSLGLGVSSYIHMVLFGRLSPVPQIAIKMRRGRKIKLEYKPEEFGLGD